MHSVLVRPVVAKAAAYLDITYGRCSLVSCLLLLSPAFTGTKLFNTKSISAKEKMLRRSSRLRKRRPSSDDAVKRQKLQCDPERPSKQHPSQHADDSLCEECVLICSDITTKDLSMAKEKGIIIRSNLSYSTTRCCAMCQFISRSIQSYNQEGNTSFELRLFSSRKSFFWLYSHHVKYVDTVGMLAVVPEHLFVEAKNVRDFVREHVPEFMIPAYAGPSLSCISSRKVDVTAVDVTFIDNCISYCNAHHHCRRSPHEILGCITLYDYRIKRTVDLPPSVPYIALSYVWGPKEDGTHSQHDSTPKVVDDVIKIAEQLGINYIWVDNYCIDQHDPYKIQQQLSMIEYMYGIYENAYLTVVDGAGSNRQNGFFGVSKPRTGCQTTVQLAGQQWMSTLRNPQSLIQRSPWIRRGWAYQEAIASRRLLIFTEEQVYFECKAMRCWESTHIPLDTHHRKGKTCFRDHLWKPIFCQDAQAGFPQYIKQYTQRSLTNSHDALNAIAGVLGRLEKDDGYAPYNFWGIPLLAPAPETSPSALVTGMAWTLGARDNNGSREAIERRNNFPSWSWAGWHGVMESFELGVFNHRASRISVRIQSGKASQESVAWSDYWEAEGGMEMDRRIDLWGSGLGPGTHRQEPYNYPWLDITTDIIKVHLIYLSLCDLECIRAKDPGFAKNLTAGFLIMPPYEEWELTPIHFPDDDPELSTENADDICRREWECMLVGHTPEKGYKGSERPFVILLKQNESLEGAERVWGGRLRWPNGWEKACDLKKGCVRLY